jgi:cell wall-associated NlpC family hydrolase
MSDREERDLGDPMETLEVRESRSSLAGALLAGAFEGLGLIEGGHGLIPPVDDAVVAGQSSTGSSGWTFVRAGTSFPGNHPDYVQLRTYGASGVLWNSDDPAAALGLASSHGAGLKAGLWLVPHQDESAQAFAQRAADAIARHSPDKVVLDIESIGKGYAGSAGWRWSDEMMSTFSRLQPEPPPLAVTVEPLQDDFNYAAYTAHGAEVWPQAYRGDMTAVDPKEAVERVVANGVPAKLVVPVIGPAQLDSYQGPYNLYTADDIQNLRTVEADGMQPAEADSPEVVGFRPALTAEQIEQDQAARNALNAVAAPQPVVDPDDLEGNLDDEDAGDDEVDGSNEDEPDEGGGEDDDGGPDDGDDEKGDDEEDEDGDDEEDEEGDDEDDEDAPGEGSNGEDADDASSDGDDDDSDSDDDNDNDNDTDGGSSDGGETPDVQGADAAYPGDNAPREQIAAWMGASAQKRGLPPELPVMAGLTESGLRNLSYGDADSVGFFQMRLSVWNQGAYAGYGDKPERQLDWFLDQAVAVKQQRLGRGLPVDDPNQYGNWIADVERPAEQYRGRYQTHLAEARELLAKRHDGGDELVQAADAVAGVGAGPQALRALAITRAELGVPYKWGGSSPSTGFDCSGLVQWAYAKVGIRIPRVTDQQILASNATAVGRKHLLPGDLVFFRDSTGYVHHVGMSLGGDRFIHAPHTGDVVKISSLNERYYAQQFTGGRRFDEAVTNRDSEPARELAASAARADERAVQVALAALETDAAEVQQPGTALFRALERQELGK